MVLKKRKALLTYTLSVILLLVAASTYYSLNPNFINLGTWILFLGLGTCLIAVFLTKEPLHYPRTIYPIGIYLVLRFLSVALAPYPVLSFELMLRELIVFISFIFIFNSLRWGWQPKTWENALINFGLIFSLIECLLAYLWHRNWWDIVGSIFSFPPVGYRSLGLFLGHPNVTAGFINLLLPILIIRLYQEPSWRKRAVWLLGFIPFVITLYFTSSRAGVVAGILGIFTTLALIVGPPLLSRVLGKNLASLRERIKLRYLVAATLVFFISLGFIYLFFVQSQTIPSHAPTIISARSEIWGPALEIIKKSPWVGNGRWSFSLFYAQLSKTPPGFSTSHAHNLFLQVIAETGFLGLALVLWIIISVIRVFLRTWKAASPATKVRLAAYAGAGVAMASHHLLDYLLESPLYSLSVLILLSLVLHEAPTKERIVGHRKRSLFVPALLLLFYLSGSMYTKIGTGDYWEGVNAGREGEWDQATQAICDAYATRPSISLYGFECALAHAHLYDQMGDPQALDTATSLQRNLIEKDPYWPVHWANLAIYEWLSIEETAAIDHMQKALALAPKNPTFAVNLAWMLESIGEAERAIDAYRAALKIDLSLQFVQLFQDSPLAQEALVLYQQDPDYEKRRVPSIQGWEELLFNHYEEAEALFNRALEINPADSQAHAGLAIVEQRLGRENEALHNARVAIFISPNSPRVQQTAGDLFLEQGLEEKAYQYFQNAYNLVEEKEYSSSYYFRTYNRFFLISDLAPQMLRGNLTPSMVESFHLLAQHLEDKGKNEEALKVQRRIDLELGVR
jgi:tetratricopeptide (TPR) repeat protein/O-antigen ligase